MTVALFDKVERQMIYTRFGAPVEFTAAERRPRWWAMFPGESKVFDTKPTKAQLRRSTEVSEFDIWWIKAKQIGAYPDGTGADSIGKPLMDGRWLEQNEFRADDGIREIYGECERLNPEAAKQAA
jgi:hypothetical protein